MSSVPLTDKHGEVYGYMYEPEKMPNVGGDVPPVTATDVVTRLREERQQDYGEPLYCHKAIAAAWSSVLWQKGLVSPGTFLEPADVALMLAVMKLVREAYRHKQDNLDDARTYIQFAEEFSR